MCAEDQAADQFSAADIAFFERKIRPLLVRRCYECHSAEAKTLQGGLRLDSHAALKSGGDSGPAFASGKPAASLLIDAVGYKNELVQMPPEGKLPDGEIALLTEWVRRGAPMPADRQAGDIIQKRTIDFVEGRNFWSFQPLRRQPLPEVRNKSWPRRRIDQFILAKLENAGLHPTQETGRRTFVRRASLDLIGLPPSRDEIAAFVADRSPDAYERLIDRLLASPHYGQRWGRYWLDGARYTDSTARWLNSTGRAYLYRDWVARALNDDVPYDDFVRRQLATDLMSETGPADTPALGFLGLSPTYWKELRLDQEVIKGVVADEWEERIDALGRTFLGLTIACARCHDHKFDPISSEDYYALAGVLASTRLVDRAIIAPEPAARAAAAREQVKKLEAQVAALEVKKAAGDDNQAAIETARQQIAQIKNDTPYFDSPLAHAVDDASLYVTADGPDKTTLVYKPREARDLALHIRGNPSNTGEVVPRRFLRVLSSDPPPTFSQGSGRLELAEAIVGEGRSLAARVIVNRVWMHHFGAGLVDTPSNFGAQGSRPTHPELLDDLAARFIEAGWSLKWLHREVMLSAAYRQASAHDADAYAADPDNRLLWRFPRQRLDVEAWRDSMLAVTGTLDLQLGGAPFDLSNASSRRRTIYGRVERRNLHDMLRLHDFPAPTSHSPARIATTTPLQQLFVLNSDLMRRQAEALVNRIDRECTGSLEEKVQYAHQIVYGRRATKSDVELAIGFLIGGNADAASSDAWIHYAQVLLSSNEFIFVD